MDIVKKNLVSILCGVIAIVCVILIFYPLGSWYTELHADVVKRQKVGTDLKAVKETQRHWPTLSTKEEDKVPLKEFPTEALIKVGEGITKSWETTTTKYYSAAVDRQERAFKPLVPGLLPRSNGMAKPIEFAQAYARLFGIDINAAQPAGGGGGGFGAGGFGAGGGFAGAAKPAGTSGTAVGGPAKALLDTSLTGRVPPSNEEITQKQNEREAAIRQELTVYINGQPEPNNQVKVEAAVAKAKAAVGEQLVDQVARQSIVYVDPALAFDSRKDVVGVTPPNDDTIFLAQVGLWVQQEICRGIYEVNKPAIDKNKDEKGQAQGVLSAPVKHLIGIRLAMPYQLPAPVAAGTAAPTDEPKLPDPRPAAKVAVDFVANPLGQKSNDMYDVLPFTLVMVCEADSLPQTLSTITYGRYMTVRSVDVQSVDAAVAQANRLVYGNKPVVQVTIRGQYIMMRGFLGKYMSANVIRGILTPPAAPGATG